MRRRDREVKDFEKIIHILDNCETIHLAMINDGAPYVVPLNFGYSVLQNADSPKLTLYFHCSKAGLKLDCIKKNPLVCFSSETKSEVSGGEDADIPCNWTTFYSSVIGNGNATIIEESDEKIKAMDLIMNHYGYKSKVDKIPYNEKIFSVVTIVKIEITSITGKEHTNPSARKN